MMNLDNYYIHATGGFWGKYNCENHILTILADQKVRSKEIKKNYKGSPINQVCLCDPTRKDVIHLDGKGTLISSFEHFVLYSPSLLFSRDLDVVIPQYDLPGCGEVADMYDEVRYNGDLSLEKLEGIIYPLWPDTQGSYICMKDKKTYNLEIFQQEIFVIRNHFKNIPVKDIFTGKDITEEDVKNQIHAYQKTIK